MRAGSRDNGAQAQARIQHRVIHLPDDIGQPFVGDRREGAAGGDQRPPSVQQSGRPDWPRPCAGGVTERENNRPLGVRRHSLMIASVKLPATVEAPISMVGRTRAPLPPDRCPAVAVVLPVAAFRGRPGIRRPGSRVHAAGISRGEQPLRSTHQKRLVASSLESPSRTMASRI